MIINHQLVLSLRIGTSLYRMIREVKDRFGSISREKLSIIKLMRKFSNLHPGSLG